MRVALEPEPFDPWRVLTAYQADALRERRAGFGATAVFVGTMRDFNEGERVEAMILEHYPAMTRRYLERISEQAAGRWALLDSLIVHRYGEIHPADPIVLVAVWSEHRAAAFDACRFIMEELKSKATFWKKERLAVGERWVEKNTSG